MMFRKFIKTATIIIVCNALAYAPLLKAGQLSLPSGDLVAPEITQDKYEQSVPPGNDHEIMVKVTDDVGIKQVTLYYRVIGKSEYQRRAMQKVGTSDNYLAKVNADEIKPPGIEYYIQAVDLAGNSLLHGYAFSPLSVKIGPTPAESSVADSSGLDVLKEGVGEEKKGISKWVWIGLGALVVGAAALGGGSSGGDSAPPGTATLSVTASEPTN